MIIKPELKDALPPQRPEEREALMAAIRDAQTCDPIVYYVDDGTGEEVLLDGHNRWEVCQELGVLAPVREEPSVGNLAQARAWILQYQMARRNMTRDQIAAATFLLGQERPATISATQWSRLERATPEQRQDVRDGRLTMRALHARLSPRPRPPRGPGSAPPLAEGHELAGVSTLTGPDGELKAEWNKTRVAGADEPPVEIPAGHLVKKTSVMQRGDGTTAVQWTSYAADEKTREDAMRDAWREHAREYAGLAGTTAPPAEPCTSELLTIYPLGDPHIGMLAWEPETGDNFDLAIASRELIRCVRSLVDRSPPAKQAIICNLGDFFHSQDDTNRTPGHGHSLDVEGRFAKTLRVGHDILRALVDATLEKHELVKVRNLPGNHDPRVAAELAEWLRAVYEREPRVEVADPYRSQQYDRFGRVLLGWHHGDRAKPAELPALMAADMPEAWGQTTERVWHCGHVHHLSRKESPGCVVETHRTMAARDAYHAGKYRAGRSLQSITYHERFGEDSRVVCNLDRVRAMLAEERTGE